MIGKAKSNKSLSATLAYNHKQGSELFFSHNMVGMDSQDLAMQMSDLQKCYAGKGKNLTIHAQLSPAIEEGKKLSTKQWEKIVSEFLNKMGMSHLQCTGYLHRDKEHVHCHLVVNRVDEIGFKLFDDSYIMLKAIKAADGVAEELGLTRAMQVKEGANVKKIGSRQQYKAFLENIIKQRPKNLEEYFSAIRTGGYQVRLHRNKENGALRGYGISRNGTYMDASAIDRKLTLKNIERCLAQSSPMKYEVEAGLSQRNDENIDAFVNTLVSAPSPNKIHIPIEKSNAEISVSSSGTDEGLPKSLTFPKGNERRKNATRKSEIIFIDPHKKITIVFNSSIIYQDFS